LGVLTRHHWNRKLSYFKGAPKAGVWTNINRQLMWDGQQTIKLTG